MVMGAKSLSIAPIGAGVAPEADTATPARPLPTRLEFLAPGQCLGNVFHVLGTHALLVVWFWIGWRALPLAAYVPLTLVACLVHQRAMSEWIHEGAHFNLVRDRRWNDSLTSLLAGVWFGVTVTSYRATHFPHHAKDGFFVPEDKDTDFFAVTSRRGFRRAVLEDLMGITVFKRYGHFRAAVGGSPIGWLAVTVVAQCAVVALAWRVGRLDTYGVYYGTLGLVYPLLNRLRVYGQHVTLAAAGRSVFAGSATSRTIDAGIADRILFTSPRLLYHYEHHRWPHLPYRALAGLCARAEDANCYTRRRWPMLAAIYRGLPA
jgi:fatty acid desaturase